MNWTSAVLVFSQRTCETRWKELFPFHLYTVMLLLYIAKALSMLWNMYHQFNSIRRILNSLGNLFIEHICSKDKQTTGAGQWVQNNNSTHTEIGEMKCLYVTTENVDNIMNCDLHTFLKHKINKHNKNKKVHLFWQKWWKYWKFNLLI